MNLHPCQFQQLQHLYFWHHHHFCHHHYVKTTLTHFNLNALLSKIVDQKTLSRGSIYGLENPVKYRLHGQEKIVLWLNKKLETVKKDLQCKISKSPK